MANTAFADVEAPLIGIWRQTDDEIVDSSTPRVSLAADRQRDFVRAAHELLKSSLARCEERYPRNVEFSVLYLVVKGNVSQWRAPILALHAEFFGPEHGDPLAPVRLEIVDCATHESLQRLIDLGLLARVSRAARLLWPEAAPDAGLPILSELEREKASALRQQAIRKLRMARVLGEGNLCEEARTALLEAMLPLGRALAVERRLPEPAGTNELLLPPLAHHWQEALIPLRLFTSETTAPWRPVLDCLSKL
jgi:hypothetical protein